jgi:hypothetical protein
LINRKNTEMVKNMALTRFPICYSEVLRRWQMMTFEQRLALALSYAERHGIRMTQTRREQIEEKIRLKMQQSGEVRMMPAVDEDEVEAEQAADNERSAAGVKPYTYGSLELRKIAERAPVAGGDLYINIHNSPSACIVRMVAGSASHTFTLPPYLE